MKLFTIVISLGLSSFVTLNHFVAKNSESLYSTIGPSSVDTTNQPGDQPLSVSCDNWLYTPDKLCGVTGGDLDITGHQITIEAVCNATDIYDLSRALVSKHRSPADVNYFMCPDLAQITTTDGFFSAASPCGFVSNKTYHVAMVYDGASLKLYRNGFLMKEVPATGELLVNDWPTTIGENAYVLLNSRADISNIFKGYINEVRIWNVVRTQEEIRAYMNTSLQNPQSIAGLMAYYTFDNLLNKQGNSAYDGVLRGTASINNTNSNCSFTADSCDISSDCVNPTWLSIPHRLSGVAIGDLDITGNQVTIEASCNAIGDTTRALVSKHEYPGDVNYFLCPDLAQITTTNGFYSVASPCNFVNNKTYHVALVYNGTTLKLYRNGFLMGSIPATGNLITNNWPTTIGENAYAMFNGLGNISNIFKGYINEVRIWNIERTQQELRTYMNTSLPSPTSTPGLLAYYTFNSLANKQGNSLYDGVLKGAASIGNSNPNCQFIEDSCLSVLPVKLESFAANGVSNSIQLKWQAEDESGMIKYVIQRSTSPSGNFNDIASVNVKTNRNNAYTFVDNTVSPDIIYYYRLSLININGKTSFSSIQNASIKGHTNGFKIFPNPNTGTFTISVPGSLGTAEINFLDIKGRLLSSKKVAATSRGNVIMDISRYPKGTYLVQINTAYTSVTKRIMKL